MHFRDHGAKANGPKLHHEQIRFPGVPETRRDIQDHGIDPRPADHGPAGQKARGEKDRSEQREPHRLRSGTSEQRDLHRSGGLIPARQDRDQASMGHDRVSCSFHFIYLYFATDTSPRCTSGVTGFHPLERPTPSSVGELMANCEAKVMAEDNVTECPRGEAGELWVRGPNITTGYWRNEEATRNTITEEGWLRTGDVGYVNEEGKWFIVDRIKVRRTLLLFTVLVNPSPFLGNNEMSWDSERKRMLIPSARAQELIKAKGHQVAPAELEGLLLDHPAVADAAVIGVTLYVPPFLSANFPNPDY